MTDASQSITNPSPLAALLNRWQHWLPYAVLIIAVFAAYSNVYGNNFLFDDDLIIRMNENLRTFDLRRIMTGSTINGAHILGGFYRPLQIFSYYVIYQLGGETKIGFHLLNIALHAANACLAYALGRSLALAPAACFWAALLWALHPLHTEAVTYMSATADPLFALLSLLCVHIVLPDFSPRKMFLAVPVFALALLAKETAVVVPALIVSCIWYNNARPWRIKPYLCTWPLWLIAIAFLIWRMTDVNFDGPRRYAMLYNLPEYANLKMYAGRFSYRVYTFFATLPTYAMLFIWPVGLHMERNFTIFSDFWRGEVIVGALMFSTAVIYIVGQRREESKPLGWGLLWFAAAHAPDTGLFVTGNSLLLEHWMYLPGIGLFLGVAQGIFNLLTKMSEKAPRYVALACCLMASCALTARTLDQNLVWKDAISFYENIFKYGELSARAHNNIALAYVERGEYNKAIIEFKQAIAMSDSYAETRHNLALTYLQLPDSNNHIDDALMNLDRALVIEPHFYRADLALAQIYKFKGDKEKTDFYNQKADQDLAFMRQQ